MRARALELRLLAICLTGLWAAASVLVLFGYRPGGPADILVGVASLVPLGIAASAIAWPPVARGPRSFRLIVALALATGLLLIPTIGALFRQLTGRGLQTLLPSPEAAYPWGLAILGTCLFAALGVSRRVLGERASRPRRGTAALASGVVAAAITSMLLASVAIANDLAMGGRISGPSRFGPNDPALMPPPCGGALVAASSATVEVEVTGRVDRAALGGAFVRGVRSGDDFRWSANVGSATTLGLAGAARIGSTGWSRSPGGNWVPAPGETVAGEDLDLAVIRHALTPDLRAAAEELGLSYVEGAQARHCRVEIDGASFRAAFPQVRWLAGGADLSHWRGALDFWVFTDGQLGEASGWLEGEGFAIREGAIQGRLDVRLAATDRGGSVTITAPGG